MEDSTAFPQSSCLVQRWRYDLSLCPVQTKFHFPQFWLLDKSQFSSSKGALPFPLTEGTKVVPISVPKCSLACGLPPSVSQVPSSSRLPPLQTSSFSLSLLPCYSDYALSWSFLCLLFHSPALPSATVSPGKAQSSGHVLPTTLSLCSGLNQMPLDVPSLTTIIKTLFFTMPWSCHFISLYSR